MTMTRQRSIQDKSYQRWYRKTHKEYLRKKARHYRATHPEVIARNDRASGLRRYGITVEHYDHLFEQQNGVCAICKTDKPGHRNKFFCVDHDHQTNQVRGLLCYSCNVGLGHFRDNAEVLLTAITYLRTESKKETSMPRGVYDRSKLGHKKTATAAAPAAAKVKGKPGRKPGAQAKTAAAVSAPVAAPKNSGDALNLFATVRANLDTLNAVADKFQGISIHGEIAAHVEIMTALRKQVFGASSSEKAAEVKVETAPAVETKTETSNGQTAPAQYASSVPMPPSIPTLPTTH